MPDGLSVLSNYQINGAASSSAVKLICDLGDVGNGITFQPVIRSVAGYNLDFKQYLQGTGASVGRVIPDSLYTDWGNPTEVFCQLLPDTDMFLDADAGTPKLSSYISNTIAPISGADASTVNLLAELSRLNIAPYYIENKVIARTTSSPPQGTPQSNLTIIRSRTIPQVVSEIPSFYHVYYAYLDPNIATNLHYPPAATPDNWKVIGTEYKTGGYQNNYGAGDLRLFFMVNKVLVGGTPTLVYVFGTDNKANNSGLTIPGLLPIVPYYWQLSTNVANAGTVLNYPVELGKWLKFEVFHQRSASFSDLTSGRSWVAITPMDTLIRTKVFDQIGGVHMGVAGLPINRFFPQNEYSGGDAPLYARSAGHRIWNKAPFIQA